MGMRALVLRRHLTSPAVERPKRGDELDVVVNDLAFGGRGVSRVDGFVVFTPDTAPGDTARVRIRKARRRFGEADLVGGGYASTAIGSGKFIRYTRRNFNRRWMVEPWNGGYRFAPGRGWALLLRVV